MPRKTSIINNAGYKKTMAKLERLMLKGSKNVTKEELKEIRELGLAVQEYERKRYVIDPPETLAGMIELKMYQLKLRQHELAKKLHVSQAKLSLILNGKQRPDVTFLKHVYKELDVDADFILEHAYS